jgi:uridine kinase
MRLIEADIHSTEEAEKYIAECESRFSDSIDDALELIISDDKLKTVALSGPTCSGKTTTAEKLTRRIHRAGKRAVVMSIDDFFLDRRDRNNVEGESPDYDSVAAIDLDLLERFMNRLNAGLPVLVPHYDFTATARTGYDEYYPDPDDIYVFEGIQAVYPEVTRLFGEGYQSIFMNVKEDVRYGNTVLRRDEIRLLRRTVRDFKFRGATPEFTLHLWEGVRVNEGLNIFPNVSGCGFLLDSFLPYEPFVLSRYALPMLETVPRDSRYRDEAEELAEKLRAFDCPYFEDRMIPENSVFREFIG